jgi:uncharacterized small protein (DUF1192 family)
MPTDEEILSAFETTQKPPSDDDILAAFGTPVKKKESSVSAEPSTNDSKPPSPLLGKSGEKVERQQSTAGNVIPSFNPNEHGLNASEKLLIDDRELALKRRDKEIESRKATKFVQENTGLKARTGELQKDANGITSKQKDNNIIPSLRDKNLLPSSKIKEEEVIPEPKKGSRQEFEQQKEEERYAIAERDRLAVEESKKDAELAKLSIADKAKSYANSFLQGGFGGLASTVNVAGTVYTKTKEAITGKKDWGSRADDEITRRTLNNFQQEYIPEANALKGSLGSQVARGFGQMGAMAASAAVTGGSAIIPSVSAFAETYDSESQEALKNGASESTANKVAIANALASMGLEAIPVLRMLNRANKTTGGTTFKQIALELGKKGVKGGLEEGGTEMAQQGVSNLIAQKTYDKKRELGSGIAESGGVGGIIGLTSTIALSALGVSLKNAKTPKEKAEIESQIAELEGLKNEAIAKEQKQIDSKRAEILASLEPDGNGGVIMTPEAKAELDKLENARVQIQEPTQQSATITEGEKPSAFASKQQESDGKPSSTEDNKGATIESAIIEIGGQTFKGKNHAEAILKAQQAGKDISKVDRQGEGMFKLSDGSVISREQAKETFGADKAEMLITQDENANEANREYEKVKLEFKREDIANKIASEDAKVIADIPLEDVPLLVKERTKTEDVSITPPIQEDITLTVQQPTITGAQKQEGATGVKAVSENVQNAGATDAESVPISKKRAEENVVIGVEIKNEGKADAPTKESVTERLNINNPFYKKVEDALVKLGLIEKYNPETGTGDVLGGYVQETTRGVFSAGKIAFNQDGSISYFDGDVKVSFDKNGNVISENTKEAKQKSVSLEIKSKKDSIANFEKIRDSEEFKYKEVTETDILGNKKKVKRLKTPQELKESTYKINSSIDKIKAELSNLEQSIIETPTGEQQNPALQDVESTAKALEGKNPEKLIPLFDVLGEVQDSESNKQQAIRVIDLEINVLPDDIKYSKDQERREQLQQRLDYLSDPKNKEKEVESLFKELEKYSSEKLANSSKRVSEAYHKAKANGKNPELVKAVESILGEQNKITNEPTKEQDVQAGVLDQSGTTDSDTEKGAKQVDLKPKSVYKNAIERADIPEDTKNTLRENLYYNVLSEKEASSIADALIEESGSHEKALATLEADKGFAGSVKTLVYVKAIDAQTKLYNKAETKEQKTLIAESQSQLLSDLDEFVRDAGRAISAVSHLYKTTEEGQLLYRKKQISKINQELTDSEISPEEFEKVKKELDNAILESANSKEVNETIKKLQEEINKLKAKLENTTSGLSATEAKRAKAKALIADGVNELVSFVGAKKNIVEENGLMKPDAQKAIGKIIKGIQLSLELNGQDLFNNARRVISEKLKGAFTYDQIDEAIANHPEFEGVWQKEKTILIGQLSKKAINGIKGLKDKTAINQLADRLSKSMKDKTKQLKSSKDGTLETITDLLKNPETIDEITTELISHLESKGYTKEEAITVAGSVYDNVTKTLDDGTDKLVKEGSKEILAKKEDLRAFINSTLENQEATIESIAKEITDNMGLSEKQATEYAKQIKQSFDKAFSMKKEKLISDKFKTKKKATKRRDVEQIYTLINAGIQDYADFKGKFYESLGGINVNDPVVDKKLRELSANISRANSDHTRYLAEQSMMDYIASKTSSSWLKRGVALGYCNMLSSYDTPLRNFSFGASVVIQDMGNTVARLSKAVLTKDEKEMYGALYTFSAMGKSVMGKGSILARDVIRTGNMFESVDNDVVSDILNNKHRKVDTPINWALDKYYKGMSLAFRNLKAGDAFLSQPINAKITFKRLYDSEVQRNSELPQAEQKSYEQIAKEVSAMFDKITPQSHTDISAKAAKEVESSQKLEVPLLITKEDGTIAYNPEYSDKKYNDIKRMHQLVAYELQEKSNGLSLEDKKEIKQEAQEKLLMGQPTGDGGMIASMVNNAFKNSPLGKLLFVPFVNVPLNSFNQIIERSPFGTMVYSGKYLSAMIRNKKLASPMDIDISSATLWSDKSVKNAGLDPYLNARQKTRIIQRQVASYAILGAIAAMMQIDFEDDELDRYGKKTGRKTKRKLIDISGNGVDYQKNEQFGKATGYWKPYSVIFYNPVSKETTSFSYKNSPLIGILAPLGKLSDYDKFENDKSAEKQLSINKVALLSTMATLEAVADQSTLKGMGDIYKSIADISTSLKDDKNYGLVKLLAKKIASGIPAPIGLVKALNQDVTAMMDMDDRKANEAYEYAMQDIPFLDTLMSIRYDHFGRPIKQIADIPLLYNGTYERDDYYGRAFPFKYTFTVMKDDVVKDESTGTEYAITKTQLAELNKVAGENLKKSLDNGVYNTKISELNKIKNEADRNKAFKKFMDNKVSKARALAKTSVMSKVKSK